MKFKDPTRSQMLASLRHWKSLGEDWKFSAEVAVYWYASDYHSGQWSNLYSALSTSPYRPGRSHRGVESSEDDAAEMMYEELQNRFGK